MDEGRTSIGSMLGTVCSLIMLVVLLSYSVMKTLVLVQRDDTNLTSTLIKDHFEATDALTASDGLSFAFLVLNFESQPKQGSLDGRYYYLQISQLTVGFDENANFNLEN